MFLLDIPYIIFGIIAVIVIAVVSAELLKLESLDKFFSRLDNSFSLYCALAICIVMVSFVATCADFTPRTTLARLKYDRVEAVTDMKESLDDIVAKKAKEGLALLYHDKVYAIFADIESCPKMLDDRYKQLTKADGLNEGN